MDGNGVQDLSDSLITCFFDAPPVMNSNTPPAKPPAAFEGVPIPPHVASPLSASNVVNTLRCGEHSIVLLCGSRFLVGRNRRCDVFLPDDDGEDDRTRRKRLRVSRSHCELFCEDRGWVVRDGVSLESGEWRRSSYGTWWNGEFVSDVMPIGSMFGTLTLGGPSVLDAVALNVWSCGESLLLAFCQDSRRRYALVRGRLDLGGLDGRLSGISVSNGNGAIRWRRDADAGALMPGARLPGLSSDFWVE